MDERATVPQLGSLERQPKVNNNQFVTIEDILDLNRESYGEVINKIYTDYAAAIRLRNREPLPYNNFYSHFFEKRNREISRCFGSLGDGFVLGNYMEGVFVPTHFAPVSLRGGYRLIKDMVTSDTPVALFLVDDLVETVRKMKGWKVLPVKIKAKFRGEEVDKTLVVNHWNVLPRLAIMQTNLVIEKKVKSSKQSLATKVDESKFAQRILKLFSNDNPNAQYLHNSFISKLADEENNDY